MNSCDEGNYNVAFYAYSQDATNGRRKQVALIMESSNGYNLDPESVVPWKELSHMIRLADVAQVGNESGLGCLGISLRSFDCLGAQSWRHWMNTQECSILCLGFTSRPPLQGGTTSKMIFGWFAFACFLDFWTSSSKP